MFDRREANKQKDLIQQQAVNLLYRYSRILLSWATGCGKTLAALKMIKLYTSLKGGRGYIICKEKAHLDNFNKDIKAHKMSFINKISKKFLYDSLHKYSGKGYVDFVILDECHAITEIRIEHLKKIIGPNTIVILLSATLPSQKSYLFRSFVGSFYEFNITVDKAIEKGILPYPKIYIHEYTLDDIDREEYERLTLEVEKNKENYEENPKVYLKNKWVNSGSVRKRALSEMKTDLALSIIDQYMKDSRRIVFTGSKKQAEEIDVNYVHSGLSDKDVIEMKDKFNDEEINSLAVVNMFRESVNLFNIQKGLIVQLDNVKLSFIQMLGRVFRSSLPEMHIIIVKGTIDDKYLRNVLKGFNKEYIEYVFKKCIK